MNLADENWIVTKGGDVRRAEDDKFIASVFGNGPISHLIAAAPELLQVAKSFRAGLSMYNDPELIGELDALIAQAEGRVS